MYDLSTVKTNSNPVVQIVESKIINIVVLNVKGLKSETPWSKMLKVKNLKPRGLKCKKVKSETPWS